jgi:hypothetical protein
MRIAVAVAVVVAEGVALTAGAVVLITGAVPLGRQAAAVVVTPTITVGGIKNRLGARSAVVPGARQPQDWDTEKCGRHGDREDLLAAFDRPCS